MKKTMMKVLVVLLTVSVWAGAIVLGFKLDKTYYQQARSRYDSICETMEENCELHGTSMNVSLEKDRLGYSVVVHEYDFQDYGLHYKQYYGMFSGSIWPCEETL